MPEPEEQYLVHFLEIGNGDQHRLRWAVYQVACFLWLCPAFTLIILNFKEHIVGASLWYPSYHLNPFSPSVFAEAKKLDTRDHTVVGALQFASELMKIWFLMIPAGIIFDLLIIIARPHRHISVRMVAHYLEFNNVLHLFDLFRRRDGTCTLFLVTVALLCIVSNFLSPSIAVLMIPTIVWRETEPQLIGFFRNLASDIHPTEAYFRQNECVNPGPANNVGCAAIPFQPALDLVAQSYSISLSQTGPTSNIYDAVILQQGHVSYIVNTTDTYIDVLPLRQVIQELSDSYEIFVAGISDVDNAEYRKLSNSLNTILVQSGPAIALAGGCYRGIVSNVLISAEKRVKCYSGWRPSTYDDTSFTRCIRTGLAWGKPTSHSQFYLQHEDNQTTSVDVHFADRVHTPGSVNSPCFIDGWKPQNNSECDWDTEFLAEPPKTQAETSSTNVIMVEYSQPQFASSGEVVWCDNISWMDIRQYTMDVSPFSNAIRLTEISSAIPNATVNSTPLVLNSDWWLASWSVKSGETLPASRIAVSTMVDLVNKAYQTNSTADDFNRLNFMDGIVADQALSMIGYQIYPSDIFRSEVTGLEPLTTNFKLQVWAYGLGSRTSYLGVAFVLAGILCVFIGIFLAIKVFGGRHGRYTTPRQLTDLFHAVVRDHPGDPEMALVVGQNREGELDGMLGAH